MTSFQADMTFVAKGTEKPAFITQEYGTPSIRKGAFETRPVWIHDGRAADEAFDLDSHGFALLNHTSEVRDFENPEEITSVYYDEISAIVRKHLGAEHVYIVDHTIRYSEKKPGERRVVTHVHNDYTEKSGPERLREHVGDALADDLSGRRIVQVNVWRPLTEPVRVAPLAVVDGSSVPFEDLVRCDIVYPDRVGEIYELRFSAAHRWYWFPDMHCGEIILIKGYDSEKDGRVRFTPHTAFVYPHTKPLDPPRISIEVRTIAVV